MTQVRADFYGDEGIVDPLQSAEALVVEGSVSEEGDQAGYPVGAPSSEWTVAQLEAWAADNGVVFKAGALKPEKVEVATAAFAAPLTLVGVPLTDEEAAVTAPAVVEGDNVVIGEDGIPVLTAADAQTVQED